MKLNTCMDTVKASNSPIAQAPDILYKIYKLYNINVKIKNINNMSYTLKTFNKNNLNSIINHCISYPLQGEKSKLLNQFIKIFYK